MTYVRTKPPITKGNLTPQVNDHLIDISWIFGPDVHLGLNKRWETAMAVREIENTLPQGYPWWAPDKPYVLGIVREIVEKYKLYDLFHYQQLKLLVVIRDPDTWGLHSEVVSVLPDLGPQGFRVRIDHYLSANLDREDLAWGMIFQHIHEQCPWQGVFNEDMLPYKLKLIREHFNENMWGHIRRDKAAFLGIKNIPHRQMTQLINAPGQQSPVGVFVPESFWQFEFVDKGWIIEDPLISYHNQPLVSP